VRDEAHVGKTLAALSRLAVQVRRSTIAPGAGASAVVQVQLAQALRADQVALVTKRLLPLRYVERVDTALLERVDTALLERDEDESEPRTEAVVRDVDVTDVMDAGDVASELAHTTITAMRSRMLRSCMLLCQRAGGYGHRCPGPLSLVARGSSHGVDRSYGVRCCVGCVVHAAM